MDKEISRETKSNNKKLITKFLPKSLTFQNIHFIPGRESHHSDAYRNRALSLQNRGFSGPLISLVPIEARIHNKNKSKDKEYRRGKRDEFDSEVDDPKSPKVSCIGQIKNKKKLNKLNKEKSKNKPEKLLVAKKNTIFGLGKILLRNKSKSFLAEKPVVVAAPGLIQMKRFSSGREAFANFDWTKQQVAPVVDRECYSDDDEERMRRGRDVDDEEINSGDEFMIPFSAPMMIGGGVYGDDVIQLEPRKEICLWKKRNMPPPKPLKLNTFGR